MQLTPAQKLKFRLLAEGVSISVAARRLLDELRGSRKLTPADYASTSGLILRLEDHVWVNAPIVDHNDNFSVWLPPRHHEKKLSIGRPATHFAFTHGDRVRLSPIGGCAMRCTFCNIPYEDRYEVKPVDMMLEALRIALSDPLQPAQHILISGGTPVPRDVPFLREVYERVLLEFPDRPVDIMMAPVKGLYDFPRLKSLGVNELSINIELSDPTAARTLMPQKHKQGLQRYLDIITDAANTLGPGRVRSIIMVGLEPPQATLRAVDAVLRAGGIPVLSPFRPDPATPLRDFPPPSDEALEDIFLRASELAERAGVALGPSCPPCTHNTLTLMPLDKAEVHYPYPLPEVV
jgi:organic radical activating enzyme